MATTNKDTLKGYFKAGSIPTEANFIDLVDSVLSENGNNLLFIDNANEKIGIGTNTPTYKLTIEGPGGFGSENDDGTTKPGNVPLVLKCNSTAFGILNANNRQAFALNIDGNDGTTRGRGIPTFFDKYNGTWNPSIYLKNGNVGIGTNNPVAKLEIAGQIKISGGGPGAGKVLTSDGSGLATWQTPVSATAFGAANFNGNVGIGTVNPGARLHIINENQDAGGNTLILGPFNQANLRLGYDKEYCWMQSHGSKPLSINPIGNNVGIGTTEPSHKFHVKSGAAVGLFESSTNNAYLRISTSEGFDKRVEFCNRGSGRAAIWVPDTGDVFSVLSTGNVGIGTTNPTRGKLEVIGSNTYRVGRLGLYGHSPEPSSYPGNTTNWGSGPHNGGAWNVNVECSIWASNAVACGGLYVISDQRIKHLLPATSAESDIETLSKLKVSNYHFVDFVNYGTQKQKGFIAQQVETVFPEAVSQHSNFIPDIFSMPKNSHLANEILTLTFEKPHGIKTGERVRMIAENKTVELPVTVTSPEVFTVANWKEGEGNVFVFGKEVNDFRTIDYNKIFCLNVSATQELAKQMKTLEFENEQLKSELIGIKEFLVTSKN